MSRELALCFVLLVPCALLSPLRGQAKTHTTKQKTRHFEIFYRPGSEAGAAVDRIAVLAERELARICSQLEIGVGGSFRLYLYDDVKELGKVTGVQGTGGFSAGNASHVPYDNDQTRYHEMVHIVAYKLLPRAGDEKRNLFFAEGLANACLEFVHGVPVHAVAKYYKDQGVLPALGEMTGPPDFYAWLRQRAGFNAYDVAGSYLRFLLDRYGARKTTAHYTGAPARKAFGVSQATLEKQWHETLAKFRMRPELQKLLHQRHRGSAEFLRSRKQPAGLPKEILGKPSEWRSLMDAKLVHGKGATWSRKGRKIIGTSKAQAWSVCELGTRTYRDCVLRATIRTERPVPIQVRLSKRNQGMVVNGTFVYRGGRPMASTPFPEMNANRKTTDLVLVRRQGKIEVWVDGRKALTTSADPTPAAPGIGFHGGRVVFEDVRVRELRQQK